MELAEYKKHKREMESDIATAVQKVMNKFGEATGHTPCNVNVSLTGWNSMTSTRPQYVVEDVSCEVDL